MLRLVLDWLSSHPEVDHTLSFSKTDKWYSEALLPSQFLARYRGDRLAESWTHADGVIGDFLIGKNRDGDLTLTKNASRFIVVEAKMFSKLSSGVKNASYYNQAARNVGCIAEAIFRANISPDSFERVGFFIIAPQKQILAQTFSPYVEVESIKDVVSHRVGEYSDPQKDLWFSEWFLPVLRKIDIKEVSWEEILKLIRSFEPQQGGELEEFYNNCLLYNRPMSQRNSNE